MAHFHVRTIPALADKSKINKATLYGWRDNPHGGFRAQAQEHWDRIFGEQPLEIQRGTTIDKLAARVSALEARLDALTKIAHAEPHRVKAMVKKSGGAA